MTVEWVVPLSHLFLMVYCQLFLDIHLISSLVDSKTLPWQAILFLLEEEEVFWVCDMDILFFSCCKSNYFTLDQACSFQHQLVFSGKPFFSVISSFSCHEQHLVSTWTTLNFQMNSTQFQHEQHSISTWTTLDFNMNTNIQFQHEQHSMSTSTTLNFHINNNTTLGEYFEESIDMYI